MGAQRDHEGNYERSAGEDSKIALPTISRILQRASRARSQEKVKPIHFPPSCHFLPVNDMRILDIRSLLILSPLLGALRARVIES